MQILSDGAQVNALQTTAWPAIDGIGRRADLSLPSMDAIAEVKWAASGGDAEYAEPTQVIVASKSASSAESVGRFWLRKSTQVVIKGNFHGRIGAMGVWKDWRIL